MASIRNPRTCFSAALMAAWMAGAGQLPALAALPALEESVRSQPTTHATSPMLLAEKKDDEDDKKKKQKSKQKSSDSQKSPQKQHDSKKQQGSQENQNRQKSRDNDSKQQLQKHGSGQSGNNRLNEKQRERIYEQGRQEGLEKGRQKGFDKGRDTGFQEGFDKGKQKGFRKGYDVGHDRARKRQQWSSWDRNEWRRYNNTRRNIWVTPASYRPVYAGYPAWARNSNWGYSRPWGGGNGWYQSSSNPYWSWWAGQALSWGVNALTTALIVNNAMNNAIRQSRPTLAVPNSNWQLYYGTVQPVDDTLVTFVVNNGMNNFQMQADCDDGLLNGEVPTTYAEAELINTACQITYGSI